MADDDKKPPKGPEDGADALKPAFDERAGAGAGTAKAETLVSLILEGDEPAADALYKEEFQGNDQNMASLRSSIMALINVDKKEIAPALEPAIRWVLVKGADDENIARSFSLILWMALEVQFDQPAKVAEADKLLKTINERWPDDPGIQRLVMSTQLTRSETPHNAAAVLEFGGDAIDPVTAASYFMEQGNFARAVEFWEKCAGELRKDVYQAYGLALLMIGRTEDAMEQFRKGFDELENSGDYYLVLVGFLNTMAADLINAGVQVPMSFYDAGIDACRKALEIDADEFYMCNFILMKFHIYKKDFGMAGFYFSVAQEAAVKHDDQVMLQDIATLEDIIKRAERVRPKDKVSDPDPDDEDPEDGGPKTPRYN